VHSYNQEPGEVSWYSNRLWAGVQFLAGAKEFSVLIYTGSGIHPASYPMVTRGSLLGVKQPGHAADHSLPPSAKVKNDGAKPRLPNTVPGNNSVNMCGKLPHVPLPGNDYTVRIHGNQTMGNCHNLENQTIGNCCNLGNGDFHMVHITETGNLLAEYD
jgi:hypothetical protein